MIRRPQSCGDVGQVLGPELSISISAEEYQLIARNIESSKAIFQQVTSCLKGKFAEEEQLVLRADEVQAAIQRLEWQLERDLGKIPQP